MLLMQLAGAGVPQGSAAAETFTAFSNLRVEPASHVMLQQVLGAGVVVTVVAGVVVTVVPGVVVTVVAGVVVTVVTTSQHCCLLHLPNRHGRHAGATVPQGLASLEALVGGAFLATESAGHVKLQQSLGAGVVVTVVAGVVVTVVSGVVVTVVWMSQHCF
jgi:hypothetical protein